MQYYSKRIMAGAFALSAALLVPGASAHGTGTAPPREAGYFRTLPPGSALPSGTACAGRLRHSSWEPRPSNSTANNTVPSSVSLPDWPGYEAEANRVLQPRIDGDFTGTTDEIIQWASCKWGFEDNVTRAVAVKESNWVQSAKGDLTYDSSKCLPGYSVPCPVSFGLTQIKHYFHPGTYPHSLRSTAFNVDYALGLRRACYEGWVTYLGGDYAPGDLWGCIGHHYSGGWKDSGANAYASGVRSIYRDKPWLRWNG